MAFTLDPSTTALIAIDMQRDFCCEDGYIGRLGLPVTGTRAQIQPLQLLFAALRERGFTIIHTREGHRPSLADLPEIKRWRSRLSGCELGSAPKDSPCSRALVRGSPSWELIEELAPLADEDVVDGAGKGKFVATDLDLLLRQRGVSTLLFGGVTTACCVTTTMREAADLGYATVLLSDCTGDASPMDYLDTLRMTSGDAWPAASVVACESVLAALGVDPAALDGLGGVTPRPLAGDDAAKAPLVPVPDRLWDGPGLEARLEAAVEAFATPPSVVTIEGQRAIAAHDGGRTDAWPHDPAGLASPPGGTALLLLDLAASEGGADAAWRQRCAAVAAAMRRRGFPVVHASRPGGEGGEGEDAALPGDLRVARPAGCAGAFSGTSLEAELRALSVSNLMLAGWGAAHAVNLTMRQASDRGFDVAIVYDAVGAARKADLYGLTASAIRGIFAAAVRSEAVLAYLASE